MKLPKAQALALAIVAEHDEVGGSNRTDPDRPCVNVLTADRLVGAGLLEHTRWDGRTWWYRLTIAGAVANGGGERPSDG